jgi:hypothetical protein
LYTGFTWPIDSDTDDPIDPMDNMAKVNLPDNPATEGFKYGIDPSTGELWFNQLINNKGEF